MSVQIVLALAAWRLDQRGIHRPVKIIWSREESIKGHHKRHPYLLRARWGANREGKIVAAQVEVIADGGGYAYTSTKVLGNATLMCTGAYEIPNVHVDAYAVYTNNMVTGAFRGFGGPQGAFAAEMQMEKLAVKLGMDPVELRLKNILREGSLLSVGTPLPPGVSLEQVVKECARRAGWQASTGADGGQVARFHPAQSASLPEAAHIRRGVGFATAFKNVGFSFGAPENCWAIVELHGKAEPERVVVRHAASEVGQGVHTVIAQMAADAAGVPLEKVHLVTSDTAYTHNSGSVSASRMTFMAGNSVRGAVDQALEKWRAEERPAVGIYQYRPPRTTPLDPQTGKSEPNFAYGYVAQAVVVDVDTETGHVYLREVISANDVGKAVNPQQVQGQIEGAVVQAAGYAVLENLVQKDGLPRDSASVHLSDPHRSGRAGSGRVCDPRISRPNWSMGSARHGGNAVPAAGAGDPGGGSPGYRRLVQRIPPDARARSSRTGKDFLMPTECKKLLVLTADAGYGHRIAAKAVADCAD